MIELPELFEYMGYGAEFERARFFRHFGIMSKIFGSCNWTMLVAISLMEDEGDKGATTLSNITGYGRTFTFKSIKWLKNEGMIDEEYNLQYKTILEHINEKTKS